MIWRCNHYCNTSPTIKRSEGLNGSFMSLNPKDRGKYDFKLHSGGGPFVALPAETLQRLWPEGKKWDDSPWETKVVTHRGAHPIPHESILHVGCQPVTRLVGKGEVQTPQTSLRRL